VSIVSQRPLVSIGMPVYNGSRYIREALDSLLAQSYPEFELQISDNASSDETPDICQAYMAKDARIHYHRNPTNLGVLKNFRRALELTSGDYFMWAACDDCWSTNYLAVLLDRLRAHPGAMLAAGRTLYIDGDGDLRRNEPDDAPGRYANVRLGTARQLLGSMQPGGSMAYTVARGSCAACRRFSPRTRGGATSSSSYRCA